MAEQLREEPRRVAFSPNRNDDGLSQELFGSPHKTHEENGSEESDTSIQEGSLVNEKSSLEETLLVDSTTTDDTTDYDPNRTIGAGSGGASESESEDDEQQGRIILTRQRRSVHPLLVITSESEGEEDTAEITANKSQQTTPHLKLGSRKKNAEIEDAVSDTTDDGGIRSPPALPSRGFTPQSEKRGLPASASASGIPKVLLRSMTGKTPSPVSQAKAAVSSQMTVKIASSTSKLPVAGTQSPVIPLKTGVGYGARPKAAVGATAGSNNVTVVAAAGSNTPGDQAGANFAKAIARALPPMVIARALPPTVIARLNTLAIGPSKTGVRLQSARPVGISEYLPLTAAEAAATNITVRSSAAVPRSTAGLMVSPPAGSKAPETVTPHPGAKTAGKSAATVGSNSTSKTRTPVARASPASTVTGNARTEPDSMALVLRKATPPLSKTVPKPALMLPKTLVARASPTSTSAENVRTEPVYMALVQRNDTPPLSNAVRKPAITLPKKRFVVPPTPPPSPQYSEGEHEDGNEEILTILDSSEEEDEALEAPKKKSKKKPKPRRLTYHKNIYRVMRSIYPFPETSGKPTLTISTTSMVTMNDIMNGIFETILKEARELARKGKKKTLGDKEIRSAVKLLFPKQLQELALKAGDTALAKFMASEKERKALKDTENVPKSKPKTTSGTSKNAQQQQ